MTRKSATVLIADMECAGSTAHTVETALLHVPGVSRVYVNPATEAAYIEFDDERCSEADLIAAVESAGFHPVRSDHSATETPASAARRPMPNPNRHSRLWWAFAGFLAIAAFFLFEEHRAHLLGVLPYLLLLACPFMHLLGHGGHHRHGSRAMQEPDDTEDHPSHNARETTPRGRDSW